MSLRIALVITVILMVANIVTIGAVGGYLFALGDGIAVAVVGDLLGDVHGDYYWPIAIWMGLVWPAGALLIFYAVVRRRRSGRRSLWTVCLFPLYLLALNVGLSVAFHVGAAAISPEFHIEDQKLGSSTSF